MPRQSSSDVAHTAITDHRILRRPSQPVGARPPGGAPLPGSHSGEFPLLAFPPDRFNLEDRLFSRDLGLALTRLAQSETHNRSGRLQLTQDALRLLDAAVKAFPEDMSAWQARGYALWQQNIKEEARVSFESALRLAPEHETTLTFAASLAAELGQHDNAIALWQRALAANPWTARSHYELARLFALRLQWPKAAEEANAVLRLNPFHLEARKLLVVCYQQMRKKTQARAEFDRLIELNPPDQESLRHWFDQLRW